MASPPPRRCRWAPTVARSGYPRLAPGKPKLDLALFKPSTSWRRRGMLSGGGLYGSYDLLMAVHVQDILGPPRDDAPAGPPAGSSDHPIRWVHVSELEDPTLWLKGGELLLTTAWGSVPRPPNKGTYLGRPTPAIAQDDPRHLGRRSTLVKLQERQSAASPPPIPQERDSVVRAALGPLPGCHDSC